MKLVIPSIDLLDGKAVRLQQGSLKTAEVLGEPLSLAAKYAATGFPYLHIVDLDAAFGGKSQFALLKKLSEASGSMKLQWGGGIRSAAAAEEAIASGAVRVVFSTALFTAPKEVAASAAKLGTERAWASLDFAGKPPVARIRGWTQGTSLGLPEAIAAAEKCGAGGLIISSVEADGMMKGPDLSLAALAASKTRRPIWLAGGMRSAADAKTAFASGAQGAIFGRALYGNIDLEELSCLQKE